MPIDKFRNKYRIPSARAPFWDYGQDGAYFITICTANHECVFGKIENGKMILSPLGIIADKWWGEIKTHCPVVELGEFVVMPNHIHGILIINNRDKNDIGNDSNAAETNRIPGITHHRNHRIHRIPRSPVQTLHATSLQQSSTPAKNQQMAAISPQSGSVGAIIRSYKSAVTRHARRLGFTFAWQSRFHDHIIRNHQEYQRITNYIINNPEKWNEDKFYRQ
ncbi:MAG: hypothetical protein QM654_14755 [Dysgonamonadaceae bacterium]